MLKWSKYNLVRVYLVASGKGNCERLIDQLPKKELDPILQEFRDSLEGNIEEDNRHFIDLWRKLPSYKPKTLGGDLCEFYRRVSFPELGSPGAFPARYIFLHDAHHVMLGHHETISSDCINQKELETIAFEGGLVGSQKADAILPVFSQIAAFSQMEEIDFVSIARAWEIGALAKPGLLEDWEIESDLSKPTSQVREEYAIATID